MNIPIICVRAKGDHASFVDQSRMVGTNQCIIIDSPYGHYDILGKQGAANLVNLVAKAKLMLKNQYLEVV